MNHSRIGFGCYRIDDRVKEHFDSLSKALTKGITLIDTSANYSDGRSEILIGNVLTELISSGRIKREDLTLVTKGGYIQGTNLKFAEKKKQQGNPFTDVSEYEPELWHCISPDFLEDQISRQLFRLGQNDGFGYIDAYLLHNPENFLASADKNGEDPESAKEEYYSRIKKAFEFLEEQVLSGKIKSYGISSNTFPAESSKSNFTSLERVIAVANGVSSNNNFKFIQFPLNLIESNALFLKNQSGNTKTVIELAKENNLTVLINRPFNAITSKGIVRFADFYSNEVDIKELERQLKLLPLLEDDLINEKLVNSTIPESDLGVLKGLLTFGHMMSQNWRTFGSIEHFNDSVEFFFSPRINYLTDYFDEKVKDDTLVECFDKYMKEVFRLFNYILDHYKAIANRRSGYIHSLINNLCDERYHRFTLSQKTILLLNSIDGVNCALAGMRKERYVDEMLETLNAPLISNAEEVFMKLHSELESADFKNTVI